MMRLSTMWTVDSTIGADGSSPVARQILERWVHDPHTVRFFRSSANFLYTFQSQGTTYFLRFADSSDRSRAAIDAELELLTWLAGAGIDVAVPVPSVHGQLVETVETTWGTFHAVVFPAIDGEQYEIEALDHHGFRRWGAALGSLHAALATYRDSGAAVRPDWRDHLELARRVLPADAPAMRVELEQLESALAVLPRLHDSYGLIHGDFELDNLIFRDGSVVILDFDDCARLWFAADIAFALGDVLDGDAGVGDERFGAFMHAYAQHHVVDPDLLAHIPLLRRLAGMLTYAKLARSVDLAIGPQHPEWLRILGQKL